jgi:hypothetical protein
MSLEPTIAVECYVVPVEEQEPEDDFGNALIKNLPKVSSAPTVVSWYHFDYQVRFIPLLCLAQILFFFTFAGKEQQRPNK